MRSRNVSSEVFIIKMNNLKKITNEIRLKLFYKRTKDLGGYDWSIIPLSMYSENGANNSCPEVTTFEEM